MAFKYEVYRGNVTIVVKRQHLSKGLLTVATMGFSVIHDQVRLQQQDNQMYYVY